MDRVERPEKKKHDFCSSEILWKNKDLDKCDCGASDWNQAIEAYEAWHEQEISRLTQERR